MEYYISIREVDSKARPAVGRAFIMHRPVAPIICKINTEDGSYGRGVLTGNGWTHILMGGIIQSKEGYAMTRTEELQTFMKILEQAYDLAAPKKKL